ncbi:MAG: ThuA domain-containing protein, partial [Planctomycetota bacterium]
SLRVWVASEKIAERYELIWVTPDPEDRNSFPGIDRLRSADALLVSVRRRTLPKSQLDQVRAHVRAGKPVIGIRTANHAFSLRKKQPPQGRDAWPQWDARVFGGSYSNHYANDLHPVISPAQISTTGNQKKTSPRIAVADLFTQTKVTSGGSLYVVSPLAKGAVPLLHGKIPGQPSQPVAWTFRRSDGGSSFYTSLGHTSDFQGPVLPGLLSRALENLVPTK